MRERQREKERTERGTQRRFYDRKVGRVKQIHGKIARKGEAEADR